MKVAIHHRAGSFSERWIAYCEETKIDFMIVDCFSSDIISDLKKNDFTHLMWHINHASSKDLQVYPYVFNSAEYLNIKTFPNFQTRWHFDDKIAQKYLLESIGAPYIPSHVFYDKSIAKKYLNTTTYPIVAKLKRGAGASNVMLLNNKKEAEIYTEVMFSIGKASVSSAFENFDQKFRVAKKIKNPKILLSKLRGYLIKNKQERLVSTREKGYLYIQKFLPNNSYDTRIIVISNFAFGIRRFNRKNDFRASGSGNIDFDVSKIDKKMIQIAFEVCNNVGSQCLAFDFVYNEIQEPQIIEVCFGFSMIAYDNCEGYWDKHLNFIKGKFNPQEMMIKNFINI
jgi:glutathione synthase/RimK-type ligase-like ATP-grasp enzyme